MTDEQIEECWQEAEQESRLTGMFISRTWMLYGRKVAAKAQAEMQEQLAARDARIAELESLLLRCVDGIAHLSELARLWEPDHSSGSDRRGWVLALDAQRDARSVIEKETKPLRDLHG